jgi:hypothetical protein
VLEALSHEINICSLTKKEEKAPEEMGKQKYWRKKSAQLKKRGEEESGTCGQEVLTTAQVRDDMTFHN